jgi:hypothetical protein
MKKEHLDFAAQSAKSRWPVVKTENSHGLFENYTPWLLAGDIVASRF